MQTVLIADAPEACSILQSFLEPSFATVCASTFKNFQRALVETSPNAVICGCHFDEGRMYDVLRYLRTKPYRLPFLAVRVLSGELDDAVYEAVKIATRALDGDAFVDFFRWEAKYGREAARERFATLITTILVMSDSQKGELPPTP